MQSLALHRGLTGLLQWPSFGIDMLSYQIARGESERWDLSTCLAGEIGCR